MKAESSRRNIEGVDRETSARLRASDSNINDIRRDIGRIETEQAGVVASWLENMAYLCVSLFMGDVSSAGGMFWNTIDAYGSYKALAEEKTRKSRRECCGVWSTILLCTRLTGFTVQNRLRL